MATNQSELRKLTDTSVLVRILYNDATPYKDLVHNGLATKGDIVITRQTYPYGALNIQDEVFYFYNPYIEDERILSLCDKRYIIYDATSKCSPGNLHLYTDFIGIKKIGLVNPVTELEETYIEFNTDNTTLQSQYQVANDIALYSPSLYTNIGLNSRVNVGNTLTTMSTAITALNTNSVTNTKFNEEIGSINNSLADLLGRVSTVESSINANWDADAVFQKLVEDSSNAIADELKNIKNNIAKQTYEYNGIIQNITDDIADIQTSIKDTDDINLIKFNTINTSIGLLENKDYQIDASLYEFTLNFANINNEISNISTNITLLNTTTDSINNDLNDINTSINALIEYNGIQDASINTHTEKIKNIQDTEQLLDTSLSTLYQTVNDILSNDIKQDASISLIKNKINDINEDLSKHSNDITNINTEISEIVSVNLLQNQDIAQSKETENALLEAINSLNSDVSILHNTVENIITNDGNLDTAYIDLKVAETSTHLLNYIDSSINELLNKIESKGSVIEWETL